MNKKSYRDLSQGDLIYIDLNPTKGHEQQGKRPCIVLTQSNKFINYMLGVAPITSKTKAFPLHVPLPDGLKIKGEVLLEHHRMIDIELRGFSFVETAPKEVIEECITKIKLLY
ncbi:type II toxin-antitoxin system PemK/MazF family toxin [Carnobacterium sp.]|uniref:type II toxin-antitoxin system PemK/MazF family toxin n=1 Tax=Carnobacterium sp. TaxID=48221 RepID=UPI002FC94459